MRSTHEDDWSIPRNIESTSGSNLPEEYTCDHMPEQQRRLVGQLRARLDRFHLAFEAERRLDDWRERKRHERRLQLQQLGVKSYAYGMPKYVRRPDLTDAQALRRPHKVFNPLD